MRSRCPTVALAFAVFVACFSLLVTVPVPTAHAQNGTGVDAQENLFGATNIHAVTGHGGLSVGVSRAGDITVLSWPGPSHSDQLAYITSNALDARDQPRFGAPEGAGVVLGLVCETDAGAQPVVTWLRDGSVWRRAQDYGTSDGPHPHTRFSHATLGLEASVVDGVALDADVLIRSVTLTRDPTSPVTSCALLSYANLSPVPPSSRVAELPVVDWAMDGRNDFAAIWDASRDAVVHFHPSNERVYDDLFDLVGDPAANYGPIAELMANGTPADAEIADVVASLSDDYGRGVWLMMTTVPSPSQHQIGIDRTPWCEHVEVLFDNILALPEMFPAVRLPVDADTLGLLACQQSLQAQLDERGWQYDPADAWQDAQDGELSGESVAAMEVAEVLRTELSFEGDTAQASLLIAAGEDAAQADAALQSVRDDPRAALSASEDAVREWLTTQYVPGTPGTRPHAVAARALLNLRVGTDDASGAIVASIARQPPYYLDWPRDGAFFNVMLDVAGQSARVDQRAELYAAWQRDEPVSPTYLLDPEPPIDPRTGDDDAYPADAWEMNYFADGRVGGTFRFEIDTTAFAVWTLVAHAGWVDDPSGYLTGHWDTIRRGADLLAQWRDPATALHAPAQEDDQANHSQTLHGAVTVFGALDIAARAARLIGEDEDAAAWEARALELRAAMEMHFIDPDTNTFVMEESGRVPLQASGLTATGPTAWLVWPMTLYPLDDDADTSQSPIGRQLAQDYAAILPALELESVGGLYFMKNTVSLAVAGRPTWGAEIDVLPALLAAQATSTNHFGEVMVVDTDADGMAVARQRVSTPHLWEGGLYYLTVAAVEDPMSLRRYDDVLPVSRVLPAESPELMLDVDMAEGSDDSDGTVDGSSDAGTDSDGAGMDAAGTDAAGPTEPSAGGCSCDLTSERRREMPVRMIWAAFIIGLVLSSRWVLSTLSKSRR